MFLPIVYQILALLILSTFIALAYAKWIRPLKVPLDTQQRGAILLTLLAMTGGFVGGIFWWMDEPRSFAWDLPPLASRMLAAAGFSFFVLCLMTVQRPTLRRMRLVMLTLFVYLVPLVVVILLLHLGQFDFAKPITYTFFGTALVMSISSTWYLLRPVRVINDQAHDKLPASPAVKAWMLVVALVTGVWGLALFITDNGPSSLIWVWPGDLLSSQLIGVMLLTIASGSLYARHMADSARHMQTMTIAYSLGLAAASLWNRLGGKPVKPAYVMVFGIIFLVSLLSMTRKGGSVAVEAGVE